MNESYQHKDLTEAIICCFYTVYNILGFGFLEKVYENALMEELKDRGLAVKSQQPIDVFYKGKIVGQYFSDLVVEGKVIVELKAAKTITSEHEAQLLNYLKSTGLKVGLLLNFGLSPEIKRRVF